jgi:predicted NAD/FAD-binding protein
MPAMSAPTAIPAPHNPRDGINSPTRPLQRIAVVGAGIAGLAAAYLLDRRYHVSLFEAEHRPGGHSDTADVDYDGTPIAVDTGFIVYNERNYPNLTALLAELRVPTEASEMSFSVSIGDGRREWAGSNLFALFAQPSNLLRPSFHRMLRDVLRFNRRATSDLASGALGQCTLGAYLDICGVSEEFRFDYLLPMGASIWSCPVEQMQAFPAASFVRFLANHGLLSVNDRPAWRTVSGGSRNYVQRLADRFGGVIRRGTGVVAIERAARGVLLHRSDGAVEHFDQVVVATHSDQALGLLRDADAHERRILGAIRYQANVAVLHRDTSLMPRRRRAWSSWNYRAAERHGSARPVSLTYWMNRLQNIDLARPLFVTMNPCREPDPRLTFATYNYQHPIFDENAIAAQYELGSIQGPRQTWFCGAWCGHGFHEDGLASGIAVALALGAGPSWATDVLPARGPMAAAAVLAAGD